MRSQEEALRRWQKTVDSGSSLESLQNAVNATPQNSICETGLHSLCWKIFLHFRDTDQKKWQSATRSSRAAYDSLKGHFMKYVEHPELLEAADPLNDDADSPWATLRKDEELRQEILQDVERCMPEEPFFREPDVQCFMTNILFIYCKINADIGYRQGMHEILAPILWVVEQDAVDTEFIPDNSFGLIEEVLEAKYIEHDSFTLFSLIMRTAKSFYELSEPEKSPSTSSPSPPVSSPIEQRSKRIHEVMLARVDPELSTHLSQIDILPQIFLIRWIRLLFGREFPFDKLLRLWDYWFAHDPDLQLIDFICVAMLLRIRWQLIEADYSQALMLLLKYPDPEGLQNPGPQKNVGPQSFVTDAQELRKDYHYQSGFRIIERYSGKRPKDPYQSERPAPAHRLSSGLMDRRRSPLPSPASFLKQQGGMEAILQGAAKNIRDRGERLGVNQALRDAAGEVRKNLQGLSPSPSVSRTGTQNQVWKVDDRRQPPAAKALVALEARNKKLGELLSEVTDSLHSMSATCFSKDGKRDEALSVTIRQLGQIKECLTDSKLSLPAFPSQTRSHQRAESNKVATPTLPDDNPAVEVLQDPSAFDLEDYDAGLDSPRKRVLEHLDSQLEEKQHVQNDLQAGLPAINLSVPVHQADGASLQPKDEPEVAPEKPARPPAIVPTRSSLAQSSFAWMLEPGEEPHSAKTLSSTSSTGSTFRANGKNSMLRHGREKSSFLFGDELDIPLDDASGLTKKDKDPLSGP